MPSWLIRLRDIVWTSVLSVVFMIVSLALAVFVPDVFPVAVCFGIASVSCALLAQRV